MRLGRSFGGLGGTRKLKLKKAYKNKRTPVGISILRLRGATLSEFYAFGTLTAYSPFLVVEIKVQNDSQSLVL